MQYGILDEDIYNFDEIGFVIGLISTIKVIQDLICLESLILFSLVTRNRLLQLSISTQVVSLPSCISSREKYILKDGIKKVIYHRIRGLKF